MKAPTQSTSSCRRRQILSTSDNLSQRVVRAVQVEIVLAVVRSKQTAIHPFKPSLLRPHLHFSSLKGEHEFF